MHFNHSVAILAKKSLCCLLALTMALGMGVCRLMPVVAEGMPDEIMLAMFFVNDMDTSDNLFVSFDGAKFFMIGTPFEDDDKESEENMHAKGEPEYAMCLHDPSLQYHDGYFWTMSANAFDFDEDGKKEFQPFLSYSKDLIHWSIPCSGDENTKSAPLFEGDPPFSSEEKRDNWEYDCAAPDLFIDDDGSFWITACLGYFGQFHGEPTKDFVSPFLLKANDVEVGPIDLAEATSVLDRFMLKAGSYSTIYDMNLEGATSHNYIDSSLYRDGSRYLLSIKADGFINEIWESESLAFDSNWTRVSTQVGNKGYEGPSLTKFKGKYYCYVDRLADYPLGATNDREIYVTRADDFSKGDWRDWTANKQIEAVDVDGNKVETRHGTVITLTDPLAIRIVMNAYHQAGYNEIPESGTDDFFADAEKATELDPSFTGWQTDGVSEFWYENGIRQGYDPDDPSYRGKEIFDFTWKPGGWCWLDNVNKGAKAISKDVYQESAAGRLADRADGTGKWVRYDEYGIMVKGWQDTAKGTYYFDPIFGTMYKGYCSISVNNDDKEPYCEWYFDPTTGIKTDYDAMQYVPKMGWMTVNGNKFWYEDYQRQGYSIRREYRGKEIYDPKSDAWYWLDNIDGGKMATSKDVYQESLAGPWGDKTNEAGEKIGKWVRYDANGHMIKGWSSDKRYYFDPIYGTMAKGKVEIDGKTYEFDQQTGICLNP